MRRISRAEQEYLDAVKELENRRRESARSRGADDTSGDLKRAGRKRKWVTPDYHTYMESGRWKRKRELAIKYHGAKCRVCQGTQGLQVHHKHYRRLGREKMKDLEVLCSGCHENLHEGRVLGVYDPMTREFMAIFGKVV